ncbi:MAG TPA: hypothetical protein VLQ47_02440 [Rhodoferax sp.]|nr:hypothetical protein [Rhodoferax sp.]
MNPTSIMSRLAPALASILLTAMALPAQAEMKVKPGAIKGVTATVDNARGMPWCEFGPTIGTPPNIVTHVYNSSTVDTCPAERSAKVDLEKLAIDLGVPKVAVNPARFWVLDRATFYQAGEVVDFGGIKAQWVASMTAEMMKTVVSGKPYSTAEITRDTEWFFAKGKPVYLLRAPQGKVWVMQVYSHAVDKTLAVDNLHQIGSKLTLPEGWKFEVKVLEKDLSQEPRRAKGIAYIMRDNLANTYMGCGFDAACNYIP